MAAFDPYHKWLGIPPDEQPPHHYRLLGLKLFESDADVIDAAADRQMSYLQTCATGEHVEQSQQLLNHVSQARVCLLNSKQKAAYDQKLRRLLAARKRAAVAPPVSPPQHDIASVSITPVETRTATSASRAAFSRQSLSILGGGLTVVLAIGVFFAVRNRDEPPGDAPAESVELTAVNETVEVSPATSGRDAGPNTQQPGPAPSDPKEPESPKSAPSELVCQSLEAKRKPIGLVDRAVSFTAPPGDGRIGANGFYLPLEEEEKVEPAATEWRLGYQRLGHARGIQLVHPFKGGHVMVTLSANGVVLFTNGSLQRRGGNTPPLNPSLSTPESAATLFPINGPQLRNVVSRLEPDGQYSLSIDGELAGTAAVADARPLELTDGFEGDGLPMTWPAGSAGVIIGPTDKGYNRAEELYFVAGKSLPPFESPETYTIPWVAGSPVDLLARLDVDQERIYGSWQLNGDVLVSPQGLSYSRIHLPGVPPAEYDLSFTATPTGKAMHIVVGLVLPGGKRCSVVLYPNRQVVGIDRLDEKDYLSNETTRRNVSFPKEMQVQCAVRLGRIELKLNGQQLIDWEIDWDRLHEPHYLWQPRDRDRLLIAANETYRFSKIELTPVSIELPPVRSLAAPGSEVSGPIDLLAMIGVKRDVVQGTWKRDGAALVCDEGLRSRVQVPFTAPDEYRLTAVVERLQGSPQNFALGLVASGRQFLANFDIRGRYSGLHDLDLKSEPVNETTFDGAVLRNGQPSTIVCTVRRQGLQITVDGKEVIGWSGSFERLSLPAEWAVPDRQALFLGTGTASCRVSKLHLEPLLPVDDVPVPIVKASINQPFELALLERQTPKPVPPEDVQQEKRLQVKDLFKAEYAQARRDADKQELAGTLLNKALEITDDPAAQYVLLDEAAALAVDAVDPVLALTTAGETARRFVVDAVDLERETLNRVYRTAKSNTQYALVAEVGLALSAWFTDVGDHAAAEEFATIAYSAAVRSRQAELREEVREHRDAVRAVVRQQEQVDEARNILAKTPDDADANQTLGLYLCFIAEDLETGLTHLARAADSNLQSAAQLELSRPTEAEKQTEVADRWRQLAKTGPPDYRPQFRTRAADWYRQAVEQLTGLEKARITERIKELDEQAVTTNSASSSRKTRGPKAANGLIGRCKSEDVDTGMILGYQPGKYLRDGEFKALLGKHGFPGGRVRIELYGVLAVPEETPVDVRHQGGSAAGGVLRLYLNNYELGAVGDDRSKGTNYNITLPKGYYAVKWVLTGGALGNCLIQFTDTKSGGELPVYYTKDMLALMRRLPTKLETDVSGQ